MSKFDKLFEAREEQGKDDNKTAEKKAGVKSKSLKPEKRSKLSSQVKKSHSAPEPAVAEPESAETESPKAGKQRGRPKAKRSDPAFIGFTTYIRKDTHLKVKIALLQEGEGREMSELVEELLSGWTKNK